MHAKFMTIANGSHVSDVLIIQRVTTNRGCSIALSRRAPSAVSSFLNLMSSAIQ